MHWTHTHKRAAVIGSAALLGAIVAIATIAGDAPSASAADHTDPPSRVGSAGAADIADLYAWHTTEGNSTKLITALTFAGLQAPSADQTGTYDPDVLYGIHIDNDGDHLADFDIYVRFGENAMGEWGVQIANIPGEGAPLVGAVEQPIEGASAKAWVGLRDDPFFFDLTGFQETLSVGALAFDPTRDSFAGTNVTAVVIEMSLDAALSSGSSLNLWATTSNI